MVREGLARSLSISCHSCKQCQARISKYSMMFFFCTGLALLAAMTADAQAPCESFSYQVEILKADIEATHCVTDQDLGEVCDTVARDAIVTCMEEDSVAARDDCMEDYFAAENIDDDGYVLSGQEVLDCCKNRKYTEFHKLFEEAHSTVCPAENAAGARRKRSTYYSQHYDQHYGLNTIWFQYHLCKDQGINCWFFTQGWNQGDFGSYYLYDEVIDGDVFGEDVFGDLDFATLLLLGSLGGGHGGYGGSRYRRGVDDEAGSGSGCVGGKCLDALVSEYRVIRKPACDDDCKFCFDGECQDYTIDRHPRLFFGAIISWFQSLLAPATPAPTTPAPTPTPAPATPAPSATQLLLQQFLNTEEFQSQLLLQQESRLALREQQKAAVDAAAAAAATTVDAAAAASYIADAASVDAGAAAGALTALAALSDATAAADKADTAAIDAMTAAQNVHTAAVNAAAAADVAAVDKAPAAAVDKAAAAAASTASLATAAVTAANKLKVLADDVVVVAEAAEATDATKTEKDLVKKAADAAAAAFAAANKAKAAADAAEDKAKKAAAAHMIVG